MSPFELIDYDGSAGFLVVPEKVASIAAKAHAGSVFKVGWGEHSEPQHQLSAECPPVSG